MRPCFQLSGISVGFCADFFKTSVASVLASVVICSRPRVAGLRLCQLGLGFFSMSGVAVSPVWRSKAVVLQSSVWQRGSQQLRLRARVRGLKLPLLPSDHGEWSMATCR